MAMLVSDTPPVPPPQTPSSLPGRIICHRNGTPFRDAVHKVIQAARTSLSEPPSPKVPPREFRHRGGVCVCVEAGGVDGGWRMRAGLHNMQTQRRRERERGRERERERGSGEHTVRSSFSTDDFPGSYSKMLLGSARYFLVSTFLSGGSHSFLWKGGCQRGVGCGMEESQSLSRGLHGNLHRLRCFFFFSI